MVNFAVLTGLLFLVSLLCWHSDSVSCMYVCNNCDDRKEFDQFDAFLSHVNILHNSAGCSTLFQCAGSDCLRQFSEFKIFKRHVIKNHSKNNPPSCSFGAPGKLVMSETPNRTDHPDPKTMEDIRVPPPPQESPVDSPTHYHTSLLAAVKSFAANLYAKPTLNRGHVQLVIDSLTTFVSDSVLKVIRSKVLELLKNNDSPADKAKEINEVFDAADDAFICLNSEFKRFKAFQEVGTLILPKPFVIGRADGDALASGHRSLVPVVVTGQFVPMREVLKTFLELPNVYSKIVQHYNDLMARTDGEISNVVQGSVWREKIENCFPGKTVFPLDVFFDDFECDDAVSGHAGDHKLGGLYYSISCLPSEFRSNLKNIFLGELFLTSDRNFGNYEVFYPTIDELNFLAKEGITINTENGPEQVYFALTLLLGDNLGVNGIIEMVECFRAHHFCNICREKNIDTSSQTKENPLSLRNQANYVEDVRQNNFSVTGVKGECCFNKVSGYHVTEGVAADVMHDMLEGVCQFDICLIINHCLAKKHFSLNTLNARLLLFDYGCHDYGDRPPMIKKEHVERGKLHLSASEMLCLTTIFGLLIGDKVPESDPAWRVYVLLKEVLDIVLAPSFTQRCNELLEALISEHHSLLVTQFKVKLKPKHHFLVHYPTLSLRFGPLRHLWSMRYEGKHRPLKQMANATACRKNVAYTLALKHQLQMNERFFNKQGLETVVESGPKYELAFKSLRLFRSVTEGNLFFPPSDKVFHVTWVQVRGTKYFESQSVLVTRICPEQDFPVFAKVRLIVIESGIVFFIVQEFDTIGFYEHFCSYEVILTDRLRLVMQHTLVSPTPLYARVGPDALLYVTPKYSL